METDAITSRPPKRSPWDIQRAVWFALFLRESQSRVGGQWVGAVWTLFEPLAHMLLLVTVMGMVSGKVSSSYEYPVFLVTGLIPFFLFQNLANRLMDGIEANRGLYSYRQVKPMDTLVARAVVEAFMNVMVYALTLGLLAWLGYHVAPHLPLEAIGTNLLLAALGAAFGLFVAVLSHDRPRLRSMIRMAMMPLYFASGVMFPVDFLPREYIEILLWNPLLHLVELSRHSFIAAYTPTRGINAGYPVVFTLAIAALGLALYRVKRQQLIAS